MTIRLLSAASVVALLTACSERASAPVSPAYAAIEAGKAAYLAGDYGTAEQSYLAAISADPSNASAMLGMGEVLEQTGRTSEAINYYRRAQQTGSGDIRVWTYLTENNVNRVPWQDGVTEVAHRRLGELGHSTGYQTGYSSNVIEQGFQAPSYQAPAPVNYAPVEYAPAPVNYAPIQYAPAPVEYSPMPPATYAPAEPLPGYQQPVTYGGGEVVPTRPIEVYQPDPAVVGVPGYASEIYSTEPAPYQSIQTVPAYQPAPYEQNLAPTYSPMPTRRVYTQPISTGTGTYSAPGPIEYEVMPIQPAPAPGHNTRTEFQQQGGYYEYDLNAVRRTSEPPSQDALFASPVPKRAPSNMGLSSSGYAVVNGVVEYVGTGQTVPASQGGLQPSVTTTTTYETMPVQYGQPVDVIRSATPTQTPPTYSAPRGVAVEGGYEYDDNGLITIKP